MSRVLPSFASFANEWAAASARDAPSTTASPAAHEVRTLPPCLFHHIFLVRPSQTPNRNFCNNSRECSIENCARLQRRTHHPPQNHFRRLLDNMKTSSKSGNPAPPKSARQTAETTAKSLFT